MPRLRQTSPAEPKTTTPAKVASLRKDIQNHFLWSSGDCRILSQEGMGIVSQSFTGEGFWWDRNKWKNLAAPQGVEPRYADPESAVLPLNEGAALELNIND